MIGVYIRSSFVADWIWSSLVVSWLRNRIVRDKTGGKIALGNVKFGLVDDIFIVDFIRTDTRETVFHISF